MNDLRLALTINSDDLIESIAEHNEDIVKRFVLGIDKEMKSFEFTEDIAKSLISALFKEFKDDKKESDLLKTELTMFIESH